jgi:hypothetical protein
MDIMSYLNLQYIDGADKMEIGHFLAVWMLDRREGTPR